jgi:hypothetical protein
MYQQRKSQVIAFFVSLDDILWSYYKSIQEDSSWEDSKIARKK